VTAIASPARTWGALFAAVQEARLFADSKTFADAVPRCPVADILRAWEEAAAPTGETLRQFVEANFTVPQVAAEPVAADPSMADHIDRLWDALTRHPATHPPQSSGIDLPRPYVVPGGRFRELYYWDSYFTMLGLAASGRHELVEAMIANFGSLIDRFGHIPNGTRSYYLSRSQPPVFYLMVGLSQDRGATARRERLGWMRREHAFWMDGAATLAPGDAHRRVVRLADGVLLNRYWDDCAAPRDEAWYEDVTLAREARQPAASLWRNLRAAAESGWDFSTRWLDESGELATIRTTRLLPVDLNCLLYGLERTISQEAAALGEPEVAATFAACAEARGAAVERLMWNASLGCHADFDLDTGQASAMPTAAAAFPLFVGLAAAERTAQVASALERLLRRGGLVTTAVTSGQQWDAPNGWAPLQWIAVAGLSRYGQAPLAKEIAQRWLALVESQYRRHGQLFEKYDVERGDIGGGGEYATETGFGWTNGVVLALRDFLTKPGSAARP
jgi:alpha,alpha-trehalase